MSNYKKHYWNPVIYHSKLQVHQYLNILTFLFNYAQHIDFFHKAYNYILGNELEAINIETVHVFSSGMLELQRVFRYKHLTAIMNLVSSAEQYPYLSRIRQIITWLLECQAGQDHTGHNKQVHLLFNSMQVNNSLSSLFHLGVSLWTQESLLSGVMMNIL